MNQVEQLKLSGQLPSPKGVALAVLELCKRDNTTLGEIARVIQTDPALSGRLIKLSNTASHISRPVASVQEAVVRQGMSTVRQLALGFSLLDQYRAGTCEAFDYQAYWSHSLLMALTMQSLGERVRVAAPDELFICGLLAQVGKLALATAYPAEYNKVLTTYKGDPSHTLIDKERACLETDHLELGTVMMLDWGIPKVFTDPLAHYELPDTSPSYPRDSRSNSLMLMLRLSHGLANIGLADADTRTQLTQKWIAQATYIDLAADTAGKFIDEVIASWQDWGKLLKIPTTALPSFAEISHGETETENDVAPLRIVVADGNEATRHHTMAMLVESSGHTVYPADNGNTALALAMEVLPHVIIAHLNLPRLDGLELCQALRTTEEGRRMHIILMADDHDEDHLSRAYEVGADGFAPCTISEKGLHMRLHAAQRLVQLQDAWEKDRAQLRHIAAELAVANRRLANAALTDLLTGLPNRRSAMDQLEQAWSASTRSDAPLSVMMLDIDYFKQINDTYGHATGDIVLREAADTLRASARRGDSVCRVGGEEFLVICPNTDLAAAIHSAERLRTTLEAKHIAIGNSNKHITVSIGVATRNADIKDIDDLVKSADQAMYVAKDAGRNRTRTKQRVAA